MVSESHKPQRPPGLRNLPAQPTSFVGRGEELAEIAELLADPACRLLTLLGPGGIGKTRLAVEVATRMGDDVADGVYFVPLQGMQPGYLVSAIAEELVLAVGTVKWYTGQIYGKLGVSNRTQAVAHARELGLLGWLR